MAKRQGLGRGLNALIEEPGAHSGIQNPQFFSNPVTEASAQQTVQFPEGITQEEDGSLSLEVERLVPNPHQPRKEFKEEALQELKIL